MTSNGEGEVRPSEDLRNKAMHSAFRLQTVLAWKRANHSPQVRAFIDVARDLKPSG